jgi:6-phosphogluconate dehydrogenase (decarboxylating)
METKRKYHLFTEAALWYLQAGDSGEMHGFVRGLSIALGYSENPEVVKELQSFLGFVDDYNYRSRGLLEEDVLTALDLWKHGIRELPNRS